MSISSPFILRPVATTLLMVVVLAGFVAYRKGAPVRLADMVTDFVDRP